MKSSVLLPALLVLWTMPQPTMTMWMVCWIMQMIQVIGSQPFEILTEHYKGDIVDPELLPSVPYGVKIEKERNTKIINVTKLDCGMRQLALDYAQQLAKVVGNDDGGDDGDDDWMMETLQHVHEALRLEALCEILPPRMEATQKDSDITTAASQKSDSMNTVDHSFCSYPKNLCIHVEVPLSISLSSSTTTTETSETKATKEGTTSRVFSSQQSVARLGRNLQNNISRTPSDSKSNDQQETPLISFTSIHDAILYARELRNSFHRMDENNNSSNNKDNYRREEEPNIKIVLGPGIHELHGKPIRLSKQDSGLAIIGSTKSKERVWLSGGLGIDNVNFTETKDGIYVGNLTSLLQGHPMPNLLSLFTTDRRWIRARYPNANPETDQWGYASRDRLRYSIASEMVVEWHLPPPGPLPNFTFIDFQDSAPDGVPRKNDSTQRGYNWYASGTGGVCSDVWGIDADSYWCSNASQGGWAEVDQECATTGQMQLPIGLTYNISTTSELRRFQEAQLEGGILHAWHSQSWAMHMFEITNHMPQTGVIELAKGGGRQGGRNWCRCDQCTYAAGWCGQHQTPAWDDTRLISGSWMIENVKEELDQAGEYYFDRNTKLLYVKPNSTKDLLDFRVGLLEQILDLRGTSNITIENVGFRDTVPTYHPNSEWSAPSGGDWSLHRGGAIFLENVTNITIRNCQFRRLDGNAVFLSRRTRNVTIEGNRFEWLGENAIATWGETNGYDATSQDFPMYTTIQRNVMRELGIFEKQSSAVGQAKAAHTYILDNIMFNMPRAAINFNDMVGGGDIVQGNLIFNTCRESGDHGPINSWDRQPFLTTLRDGVTKSFEPVPREIRENFIIANYGASQGIDNDDGSSWFHIHHNLFYSAEGFKMDYGGHDSVFEYNLIIAFPYDGSQCFNMGSFYKGHGDFYRNNRCLVGVGHHMDSGCGDPSCASPRPESDESQQIVGHLEGGCENSAFVLEKNQYFTPDGKAKIGCQADAISLEDLQSKYGMDIGSTHSQLPDEDTLIQWAKEML